MKTHATTAPVDVPHAAKWYETHPNFNYFGGDAFIFTPSTSPTTAKTVAPKRSSEKAESIVPESFWQFVKSLFR